MAVIINDFEIVTTPLENSTDRPEPVLDSEQNRTVPIRPEDIERIQQRLQLRRARIWAE
ncbi:hypothetical protein [Nitrosomonas nitrosa]|uniref:hypothetical protein n=1 Tax=Nitrosomonas nitrosa TaxID=52442 RepID=UPI0023F8F30F|nr:hypothetical protein [Nitrosomonas nitrosa]MCO6434765.1 hypothetical protein [Nitrosomonas nitrosa]